ncbi:MAG: branched-chain amino acid transport system permease protein [Archaeoglobi archaeon]|nr:branched-chain amino acid transport system permease protein [Archaeoglobi archaeon]
MSVIEGALVYSNLLALLSIGLTITYITTSVPNFAQGSFAVLGSYIAVTLLRLHGVNPYLSIPLAVLGGGALGLASYFLILRPLMKRDVSAVILMISTLALDLILLGLIGAYSEVLTALSGKSTTKFIFTRYDFNFYGIPGIFLISTLVISLLLLFLFILLYRTRFGIAMRASMENPSLAEVMGVNVEHTRIFSWALSGALAGIAGALLPFRQEIVPATGGIIIVSIFAASIVGGISSIYGALVGAYLIGFSESLITYGLSSVFGTSILLYSRVISLAILVITLVIAPKGLMGLEWRKIWKSLQSSLSGSGSTE